MDAVISYNQDYYVPQTNNVIPFNHHNVIERSMGDALMDILRTENVMTVFQPIISLKEGSVLGYEALSRGPKGSMLSNPADMFEIARLYGKLWDLESLCRGKALENASKKVLHSNVFINIDPDTFMDERFKKAFTGELLKKYNMKPENIVLEITENNFIDDIASFKKIIEQYRDQGFKIAIDDAGAGYSGLKLITEIHPNFIKLDMNLTRDLDKDGVKYALIKTFYDFCLITDIKLIAEGIETKNELNTLIDIGINFGQGYLIQKPLDETPEINRDIVEAVKNRNSKKQMFYLSKSSAVPVGDICRCNLTIKQNFTGSKVLEIFNNNPNIYGLPVVEDGKLVGLVARDKFFGKLGTQYGYALFNNRPISLIMDKHPLCVEYTTSVDIVSKLAMNRSGETLYDYIIVTEGSQYKGIVTVKDLLEKSTELEINYAKHLNPLSGLPGNMLIEQKLASVINISSPFTVLYIDIDNFKVYNDAYGFENGDRMLQFLARVINNEFRVCPYNHFIGHIGGDDFIIIVESYNVEDICNSVLMSFEKGVKEFYNANDLKCKYITAKNRHGIEEQFGLVTLSIAGLSNKNRSFKDVYDLSEQASKVKKKCKEIWSNCFCFE